MSKVKPAERKSSLRVRGKAYRSAKLVFPAISAVVFCIWMFFIPTTTPLGKAKPSKPLCKECLEIVQRAKPVDISFEPVDPLVLNSTDDPYLHLGAKGPDGEMGFVHDETALRKLAPALDIGIYSLREFCGIRDDSYKMLHEKVYVDLEGHAAAEKRAKQEGAKPRAKIFCSVYTSNATHGDGHKQIPAIGQTWGQKCDGFMAVSDKTDVSIGAVNILHEDSEDYHSDWQKVRSILSYIYDHYYDKYDWFHIGDDELYLIPENLRLYLESEEIQMAANGGIYLPDGTETTQVPLFLGRRWADDGDMNNIFNDGGVGYTMNKAALKILVVEALPYIEPHSHKIEDRMVAKLLKNFNVYPYETKDETGGERYMPFMPGDHYSYTMPPEKYFDWYEKYSINIKEGPDHCAAKSVAFHYVQDINMKRFYVYLYHLCPDDEKRQKSKWHYLIWASVLLLCFIILLSFAKSPKKQLRSLIQGGRAFFLRLLDCLFNPLLLVGCVFFVELLGCLFALSLLRG